jgi:tRNA G46 methylase TrmB
MDHQEVEDPCDDLNSFLLDSLAFLVEETEENNDEDSKSKLATPVTNNNPPYNARKPKWWKQISGNPTKAQQLATKEILETHRLPRVPYGSFIRFDDLFPASCDNIWLEVGFGRGENLLALSFNKNIACIGAEISLPGIGILCRRMQQGIRRKSSWTGCIKYSRECDPYSADSLAPTQTLVHESSITDQEDSVYDNVRIYPGDGVKLLPYIQSSSLAAVLATFPDPFSQDQYKEFRLIQIHTLVEIHRVLNKKKPSSGRFFLATDNEAYYDWSHSTMDQLNSEMPRFRLLEPCPDRSEWLPAISRYEQKGWDEGRRTRLSCWEALTEKI